MPFGKVGSIPTSATNICSVSHSCGPFKLSILGSWGEWRGLAATVGAITAAGHQSFDAVVGDVSCRVGREYAGSNPVNG